VLLFAVVSEATGIVGWRADAKQQEHFWMDDNGIQGSIWLPWWSWLAAVNDDYLGINPGGSLGAAGLLVEPSLQGVASCQVLHHHHGVHVSSVRCPFNKASMLTG